MLTVDELSRYNRQIILPHIGAHGQERLKNAKVLCIGAGGLASPALLYLCAAGVGTLGIVDADVVDVSNLQRQILYHNHDVGQSKVAAAKAHLQALNPLTQLIIHAEHFSVRNAQALIAAYDIIIDATDNFSTRYLINAACFHQQKPYVSASVLQFQGQCAVFTAANGPCYRCLYDVPPLPAQPNCAESGVLGVVPGLLGTLQATEVLKLILGIGTPLIGQVLTVDVLSLQFQLFSLPRNPDCQLCGKQQEFDFLPHQQQETCTMTSLNFISAEELRQLQQQHADFILLDVREPDEYAAANLGGVLIPLAELPARVTELDKNKRVVVHCKAGPRSERAAAFLLAAGFRDVAVLQGGIMAWADLMR